MLISTPDLTAPRPSAAVFAALGDETRLSLLNRLSTGRICSITELTDGTHLTRQAVTKHLRVLQKAHFVRGTRSGRESRFQFNPAPINEMKAYLDIVSQRWDDALGRLIAFIEANPD